MATKYKVTGSLVLLPYYPDPSTGRPLVASKNSSDNAMKDEYGRAKVGNLTLTTGSEFYTGDNAPDDAFHTFSQDVVDRFIRLNAVEEVDSSDKQEVDTGNKQEAQQEASSTKKKSSNKSSE